MLLVVAVTVTVTVTVTSLTVPYLSGEELPLFETKLAKQYLHVWSL